MTDFHRLLSDFFNKYLSNQKGASENTVKTYRDCFVELLIYLKQKKNISSDKVKIEDIDYKTITEFLDDLEQSKGISTSTRNNRLAAIKSFFRYISYAEPKYIDQCASILNISQKKYEHKEMNYFSINAMSYFLSQFNIKDKKQLRDLSILLLLYESGARVSELINIRRSEIRLTSPATIVLHGKGSKTRVVPIDHSVCDIISKYLESYKISNDEYIFLNSRREKLTRRGVDFILQKWFETAKAKEPDMFPKTISPHGFRHSKAMHLLENGVNLIYIRDFLGHSSVTTTEIYSKANPELKRKFIEQASKELIDSSAEFTKEKEDELLNWLKNNI